MIVRRTPPAIIPDGWLHASNVIVCCLLLCGVLAAQDLQNNVSERLPQVPVGPGVRGQMRLSQFGRVNVINQGPPDTIRAIGMTVAVSGSPAASGGARLITLQEAQQKAAPADNNPMVRLGQLQVEVARQARLGTESTFFPQIGSAFDNLHFNKFMGEQLQVRRPIQGGTTTIALPLVGKDQTFVAVTATQPITPLFQLRELYKINLADERIARAKAGMPISETANKVEKAYYELLVAQRQLAFTASMAALFFESAKR
jgi:outer membrane protein TolC